MIAILVCALLQEVSFEGRKLATRPEGTAQSESLFSPDGRGVAWLEFKNDRWFVQTGDRKHDDYDEVSGLCWSPDGKKVSYLARSGKQWRAVIGDGRGEPYEELKNLKWSRDGKVVAYEARQGKVVRMVVNGKPGEAFEQVNYIEFGPDGRVAYGARKGDDWFLVSNEKTVGPFEDVDPYEYSGRALWYKSAKGGKKFFTVGDKTSGPFDDLGAYLVDPDGARVAFGVVDGGKGFLVVDGVKTPVDLGEVREIVPGSDGKTLAYSFGDLKKNRIVMGEWKSPELTSAFLSGLTIAPDGKAVACRLLSLEEKRAWHGAPGESFEEVSPLKFSPKGDLCYSGTKNSRDVLVMGTRRVFECDTLWSFEFTPAGTLVLMAESGKKGIVRVGDKVHGPYDSVSGSLSLSPDGKKVAFGATVGRELWWKVVPAE